MVEDFCGYIGRAVVMITVVAAIVLGIVSAVNCQFLYYETITGVPWEDLDEPFHGVTEAYVGIFSYEIIQAVDPQMRTDGCEPYDGQLGNLQYEALMASQLCAIFAPILALLGLLVNALDTCICRFSCSFLMAGLLFLGASGLQAGTFSAFAEPDFCFEGDQDCDVGTSVYLGAVSAGLYFFACFLLCCLPTPDPLFSPDRSSEFERRETKPTVVVQPVVIRETVDDDVDEAPEKTVPPKKKISKRETRKPSDEITSDDFDFEVPPEGTTSVEYEETTGQAAGVEVDEATDKPVPPKKKRSKRESQKEKKDKTGSGKKKKKKKKKSSEKITSDDFDFEVPQEGTTKVEYEVTEQG